MIALSFDLENVVVHLENTSGDGTRTIDGRGRVDDAPGMEIELGTVDLLIESTTGEVTDATHSLARAAISEAQLGARAMLVSVEAASDSGLCVQLRLDRHGISSLDRGPATPDATVIDAVTGRGPRSPLRRRRGQRLDQPRRARPHTRRCTRCRPGPTRPHTP